MGVSVSAAHVSALSGMSLRHVPADLQSPQRMKPRSRNRDLLMSICSTVSLSSLLHCRLLVLNKPHAPKPLPRCENLTPCIPDNTLSHLEQNNHLYPPTPRWNGGYQVHFTAEATKQESTLRSRGLKLSQLDVNNELFPVATKKEPILDTS